MDEDMLGTIFWFVIAAALGFAAWQFVAPRLGDVRADVAAFDLAALGLLALRIVMVVLLGWIVIKVLRWRGRRRAEVRTHQREAFLADLHQVVKVSDKKPAKMAWRGRWVPGRKQRIRRARFLLAPGADLNPEVRAGILQAARRHLGPVRPPSWPAPHEIPWVTVVAGDESPEPETEEKEDDQATRLEKALDGLVPAAAVTAVDGDDGDAFQVSYGETTRDQSGQWRARVLDQAAGRLDVKLRATWDRSKRLINLTPLPSLPHPIRWADQQSTVIEEIDELAYGTDEEGRTVTWPIGDRQPHAIAVGGTGSGKTETMKTVIASALHKGFLVAIIDPKAKDFAEFLGKPGVLAVATGLDDRAHLLQAMLAEVHRRNAALALTRLRTQHASIADMALPSSAKIDAVPILFVVDEVTQMTDDFHGWWAAMDKETRKEEWGTDSKTAPVLEILPQIAQLARACRIHLLLGMQRADARNFGPNTAMRDNVSHLISQDRLKPLGSEMLYGDRITGCAVEIESVGEGLSNGSRYDETGQLVERHGTPGRIKAWWLADAAEQPDFWERVREVAPDESLVDLGEVSAASRDPQAAAAHLMRSAYPGWTPGTEESTGDTGGITAEVTALPSRPATSSPSTPAEPVEPREPAAVTDLTERAKAATATKGEESTPPPAEHTGDMDASGVEWTATALAKIKAGDRVMFIDGEEADVVEVVGEVEDEDFGDELFRLVVDDAQGAGRIVDMSPDEMIDRANA